MPNRIFGGFHPVNMDKSRCTRYEVASNFGTAIFAGDPMNLVTAGVVEISTAGSIILGVCREVSFIENSRRVFRTHMPANTTYTPTTRNSINSSYAWVWDDPDTEYWATVAGVAATDTEAEIFAAVGSNMNHTLATAGNTFYARSGAQLDGTPVAATAQWRILEIRRNPAARDFTAGADSANWQARVRINEGQQPTLDPAGI